MGARMFLFQNSDISSRQITAFILKDVYKIFIIQVN